MLSIVILDVRSVKITTLSMNQVNNAPGLSQRLQEACMDAMNMMQMKVAKSASINSNYQRTKSHVNLNSIHTLLVMVRREEIHTVSKEMLTEIVLCAMVSTTFSTNKEITEQYVFL